MMMADDDAEFEAQLAAAQAASLRELGNVSPTAPQAEERVAAPMAEEEHKEEVKPEPVQWEGGGEDDEDDWGTGANEDDDDGDWGDDSDGGGGGKQEEDHEDMPTEAPSLQNQNSVFGFNLLDKSDLSRHQRVAVCECAELLGLDEDDALTMLRAFSWNAKKVSDLWFTQSDSVREKAGLPVPPPLAGGGNAEEVCCQVCFEDVALSQAFALDCTHVFCVECWGQWVQAEFDKVDTLHTH